MSISATKVKILQMQRRSLTKVYNFIKKAQAMFGKADSFRDLARRIELGEVLGNIDKNNDSDGIIKKNSVRNVGTDNDYDGERQEDLRGTEREVQGRPAGDGTNRSSSQVGQSEILGSQGSVRASLLTEQQAADFESINSTIHFDEWQDASSDLEVFSNEYGRNREELFVAKQFVDGRILYANSKKTLLGQSQHGYNCR